MLQIPNAVLLLAGLSLVACQAGSRTSGEPYEDTRLVATVVARVDGRPIGASDIETRMRADGLSAEAALQSLIDEEVLIQEAERRGHALEASDALALERLMVRSLLREFEEELTPESISGEEVRADYEQYADRMHTPERRRSWQILVKGSGDAAESRAETILEELRTASEPRSVFERYADVQGVKTEDLPPISSKAGIKKPYKDALFGAKSIGLIKKPIKTSYGWHLIYLAEITPEDTRSLQEAEPEIRARLSQKKRFERVVETVQSLEARGLVQYNEPGIERLLSMAGLPERSD